MIQKTPTCNDLMEMSHVLNEHFLNKFDFPIEFVFKTDKETLQKINEDFYYRNNTDGKPENVDEIIANIGGCIFRYELINKEEN